MIELQLDAMEKQLREMKKETLRMKRLMLFTGVVFVFVVLTGFQPPGQDKVVEATQFLLKDQNKRTQAKLFVSDDGLPALSFYDKNGKCRVEIGIWELQAGLVVLDETGKSNISLRTTSAFRVSELQLAQPGGKSLYLTSANGGKADQFAGLAMGDNEGGTELFIVNRNHTAGMTFLGETSKEDGSAPTFMSLVSNGQAESEFNMCDKQGKELLILKVEAGRKASIRVHDDKQRGIVTIPNP